MPLAQANHTTVTFVFTDIEGSTRLWDAHPESMRNALARHDSIVREAFTDFDGQIFKTMGDAFCAAFSTATQAVKAAVCAQKQLLNEPWPPETKIRIRIAIHTGAVECRDNDYFGPPVNRVARLLATAHGDQILVSQSSFELARDTPPEDVRFRDLGLHQLKDLVRPEQIYQLLHPSLPDEFPPIRSISDQPNNLPVQFTSFLGREEVIEGVRSLLTKNRLVTLTGSGGSGKTRLSIHFAAEVLSEFPAGAWFVELAAATEDRDVARTIGQVLSVPDVPDHQLIGTLVNHIQNKVMLIVLDNCEHLISESARVADQLLTQCPGLKIIATSREALGIAAEVTLRVPPLSLPTIDEVHTAASLSQYASVQLFLDRALQVNPGFAVTNANAPALAAICCQLDGIPLAVELAAARVRAMTVEQIAARLDQRFSLLTGGPRLSLPRQKTLRALIDWSYDLLLPLEQTVFQRLSIFVGGWTLEAAETICADAECAAWQVSDAVTALVDKSLVTWTENDHGNRYGFLESIRDYACQRLLEAGEMATIEQRHFEYFSALVSEALPKLRGKDQVHWLGVLDAEIENIRFDLHLGKGQNEGLRLASNLYWYWYLRGRFTEGRLWLTTYLENTINPEPKALAEALNGAGVYAETQGDFEIARDFHLRGLEISLQLGERWNSARTLNNLGNVYGAQGKFEEAEPYWRQALEGWEQLDAEGLLPDRLGPAAAIDNLGSLARDRKEYALAQQRYEKALEYRKEASNDSLVAGSLLNLGLLAREVGQHDESCKRFHQGLSVAARLGFRLDSSICLLGLAEHQKSRTAAVLLGHFEKVHSELGFPLDSDLTELLQSVRSRASEALSPQEYAMAWSAGQAMSPDRANELALDLFTD
jgi:predicted ATPase/class 3 adenylate cyclase/Tfp pilus assembly protein PilF